MVHEDATAISIRRMTDLVSITGRVVQDERVIDVGRSLQQEQPAATVTQ
jgi:hypothetical protein